MAATPDAVSTVLESVGRPYTLVPAGVVKRLGEEYDKGRRSGAIDQVLQERYMPQWVFEPPSWAKSIVIIATPKKINYLTFHRDGGTRDLALPPTYVGYQATTRNLQALLEVRLGPLGYRVEVVQVPLKLLAARSGLVRYGRNNITYLPGHGSFFQLGAFYTDIPVEEKPDQEPQMLDACLHCKVCTRLCPTGIIGENGFQIHAGRCLTFFNESKEGPPDWVDPGSHHSLIGCMRCQESCPENRKVRANTANLGVLSEEETDDILKGSRYEDLPSHAQSVIAELSLTEGYPVIARNLRLVLH